MYSDVYQVLPKDAQIICVRDVEKDNQSELFPVKCSVYMTGQKSVTIGDRSPSPKTESESSVQLLLNSFFNPLLYHSFKNLCNARGDCDGPIAGGDIGRAILLRNWYDERSLHTRWWIPLLQ